MTPEQKDLLKLNLRDRCLEELRERLAVSEQLILRAQESANNEGKSSAGDKYETGRSMGQLEKQMYQKQAQELRNELSSVVKTDLSRHTDIVQRGSLVVTDSLLVFVCAGLGKRVVDDSTVLFISPAAPLFNAIEGKTVNDHFILNKQSLTITEIW